MSSRQTYGATTPDVGGPSTPIRRSSPLPRKPLVSQGGHASVTSSIVNLTNTVIGAGALAFPSAFASMGLIPGIVSCVFSGCMTAFGLYLLSRCATVVGTRPGEEGRKASFNEVARLTFSKGWAIKMFDLAIAIKCFGVSVSYLIICKILLPKVVLTFSSAFHRHLSSDSILLSSDFWLLISMVIVVPISFLRTLDALRFTSQIALGTVVYLILVVVGWFMLKGADPQRGPIVLARFEKDTLSRFPVQVFAFTCAQNIFPIYNELSSRNQQRMNIVIFSSIGTAAACYEILGIIGYLTFGNHVGSNIIAMYPPTSLIVAFGRLGIVLLVGLSYPLQLLPCRNCIHTLTRGLAVRIKEANHQAAAILTPSRRPGTASPARSIEEDERDPLMPRARGETLGSIRRGGDMTSKKFIFLTTVILILGFLVAFILDDLEVVLAFVGSTGSTILSFILPGFFYFNLFRQDKGPLKWAALTLGIYGIAVMAFCLTFNIVNLSRS